MFDQYFYTRTSLKICLIPPHISGSKAHVLCTKVFGTQIQNYFFWVGTCKAISYNTPTYRAATSYYFLKFETDYTILAELK